MGNPVKVFLLIGQSNIPGEGNATQSPTVSTGTALKYVSGALSDANNPFVGPYCGFVPQFAITYHNVTGKTVGFISASVPSSAIIPAADLHNVGNWGASGTLFDASVSLTTDGMAAFSTAGYDPELAGIIYCQGEAEAIAINSAVSGVDGSTYAAALTALIARYRAEFDPNLPFYIIRTGTFNGESDTGPAVIRLQQETVASQVSECQIIYRGASDFVARSMMGDTYHYSQPAYNELGHYSALSIASGIERKLLPGMLGEKLSGTSQFLDVEEMGNLNSGFRLILHGVVASLLAVAGATDGILAGAQAGDTVLRTQGKNLFLGDSVGGLLLSLLSAGKVGVKTASPSYDLDVHGTVGFAPGNAVTPVKNGDVVLELTNNSTLTVRAKGSDGIVRSASVALA